MTKSFEKQTKQLIDDLKSVCANYGLGNDGNEFKVITQTFLYKFLNDKFVYEIKKIDNKIANSDNWEEVLGSYSKDEYEFLIMQLNESTARFKPDQLITSLFSNQNEANFSELLDSTLLSIASDNSDVFSVLTHGGEKIVLFENISKYVTDNRDEFCRAIVNKLVPFSFEHIFDEKFDFFATIFEYLIKDYNTNSGGKYAEYFTPHAVAKIMAKCLVDENASDVTCYDPSAGSGTLLMNLAHEIGEDRCSIYSQDISQKSSGLLRLNLILNDLVHSIHNVIKGNTILDPFHSEENGSLKKFDYIVSNPPFKLDFSDYRDDLETKVNKDRFFAGIPKIPNKKKETMAIYLLFIQHIMASLAENGKAAVVVPTGFITAQSGIEYKIRQKLVDNKMLKGVITMPSNIFATTGTNVSILFLDKSNLDGEIVLMNAAKLGTEVKEGKNKKTVLSSQEENLIINAFRSRKVVPDFSITVTYEDIEKRHYSLSAGQYFDVTIELSEVTPKEFYKEITLKEKELKEMFDKSSMLDNEILDVLGRMNYE